MVARRRATPAAGAFQKLSFVNTYLPRMGDNGFGWYDAELTSVWGVPFPTKDAPLVITPGIATHWLSGPAGLDIPAQLHEVYTEFRWLPKIGEAFRLDVAVQPGFYSDWDGSTTRRFASWATFPASTTGRRRFNSCSGRRTSIVPTSRCCRSQGLSGSRMRRQSIKSCFPSRRSRGVWVTIVGQSDVFNSMGSHPLPATTEYWFFLAGELGGAPGRSDIATARAT